MVWKRPRRPFAGGVGSRRRAPGFERHGSRPAFRGPRNMETDGIMRKEDGPIRHKENGAVRFRCPCRESNPGHAVPLARKRPAPPEYGRCPAWGVASADGCDADEVVAVAVAGLQPLAAVGGRVHACAAAVRARRPGSVLPKVVKGVFQGVGRFGAQGKGVAGRIRPHWDPICHPVLVSMVRGEGVPAACPRRESNPAPSKEKTKRRYRWGLGRVREGKE